MPMLHVENLSIELQTQRGRARAVRDISFSMERGDTLGLVGESGCGKSITAMALMGLLPENARVSGSIRLGGQELVGLPDRAMARLRGDRIGMIFQEPMTALNPVHTIARQVAEPLRLHRAISAADARRAAVGLLERVGIPDAARRAGAYPHQFSGGQRQRITIAMALACDPDLLIADEPTTALDVTIQKQILDLIRDLVAERGMGLILISHDLGVIAQNVARTMVMYGGSVVENGPTASLFAHPMHPYTLGLFGARPGLLANKRRRLATIPGTVPELADLPPGCPFAGRCGYTADACFATVPPPVEVDPAHAVRCIRLDAVTATGGAQAVA
ncbi:ABC transporter ATP-binding protein [Ramlibacter sp. AN1015]|uniref:ABC transporter ATP-binding protein n=1 Tax=Ramlibacter sp. AN1015 TaxID=3133428 RepID=UPI0030BDD6C7